jgi:hypothetical protein
MDSETTDNFTHGSWYPGQNMNRASPKHDFGELILYQRVLRILVMQEVKRTYPSFSRTMKDHACVQDGRLSEYNQS